MVLRLLKMSSFMIYVIEGFFFYSIMVLSFSWKTNAGVTVVSNCWFFPIRLELILFSMFLMELK